MISANKKNFTKAVLASIPVHIAVLDEQGTIVTVNKAWQEFAGKNGGKKALMKGIGINYLQVCQDSVADGDQSAEQALVGIRSVLNGTQNSFSLEYPCHSPNEKRWFSMSVRPLAHHKPGAVVVHSDITARIVAERQIRSYTDQLEQMVAERTKELTAGRAEVIKALEKEQELSELKSRFVSMASHEFRTPLTTILASADLINTYIKENKIDKCQRHIERIKSSVGSLTDILNDFLSLEKLESGKIHFNPIPGKVPVFVEEVLEQINLLMPIHQSIHFNHSGQETAILDWSMVKNILFNLLSNAIKYSPNGEDIYLQTTNRQNVLTIRVKDAGIGIPENEQAQLFGRFFRASNATNIQGTGLGLTIIKHYLDLMQGQISFASRPNEGSTFEIKIPQN